MAKLETNTDTASGHCCSCSANDRAHGTATWVGLREESQETCLPLAKITETPKNDFHWAHLQVPFTNAAPPNKLCTNYPKR
jgi:hypothetical protein